jgi:hypothetical protein
MENRVHFFPEYGMIARAVKDNFNTSKDCCRGTAAALVESRRAW